MKEDYGALAARFPTPPANASLIHRDGFGFLTEEAFLTTSGGRRRAPGARHPRDRTGRPVRQLRHRPGRAGVRGAPTLVLHRRNCLIVDVGHASYLAEHLPHASLRSTPGADVRWFTDTPDRVRHTLEFL